MRLFDRIGRSVVVTDAGRAFEGPARRMLRERALVFDAVGAVRALDTGTLDLVALPTLAVDPLAPLVGRFRMLAPGCRRARRRARGRERARGPRRRRSQRARAAELPARRDDLVAIELARQEIVAVCPPGTQLPAPGRLPVARLAGMPLVATPPGTSTRDLLDRALAAASVAPVIAVEISQREAIAPLVLERRGDVVPAPVDGRDARRAGRGRGASRAAP